MRDFDFTPSLEHRGSGKCCPSDAQLKFMKDLCEQGEQWRVRIKDQNGLVLRAYPGSRAMLDTVTTIPKGKKKINLMEYFPS